MFDQSIGGSTREKYSAKSNQIPFRIFFIFEILIIEKIAVFRNRTLTNLHDVTKASVNKKKTSGVDRYSY